MIDFIYDQNGNTVPSRMTEKYFKKNHPSLYAEILNHNSFCKGRQWQLLLYNYINRIEEYPKCENCGKEVIEFRRFNTGYNKTCSAQCSHAIKALNIKSSIIEQKKSGKFERSLEKRRKTNLERYGVEYVTQSADVQKKIMEKNAEKYGVNYPLMSEKIRGKAKRTNRKKYGHDNPMKNKDVSGKLKNRKRPDDVLSKTKKTNVERYGVENVWSSQAVREKTKKTNVERYGVAYPGQSAEITDKMKNTIAEKNLAMYRKKYENLQILGIAEKQMIIHCDKCGRDYEISPNLLYQRVFVCNIQNPCTGCNPINQHTSISQVELLDAIKAFYNGKIMQNDRMAIGLELDIYLPDSAVAIEYDGLYWHSELYKDDRYHLSKTVACENAGIFLLHVFEDEFMTKRDILIDIIRRKTNSVSEYIVSHARKCNVSRLGHTEASAFFNENHIQGSTMHSICYAITYNNEILAAMSFGKIRNGGNEGEYEMHRFCTKMGNVVIGGGSKLFSRFVREMSPKKVITYADRRLFNGKIYEKMGFVFDGYTSPGYYYVIDGVRKNRFNYRKKQLVRAGFDPDKTEREIMKDRGLPRIFDCGNLRYVWHDK